MPSQITLLVVGPTTDGKSTFVNRLRQLSAHTGDKPSAPVGKGIVSTTKTCDTEFYFSVPLTDYKLVGHDGQDINLPSHAEDKVLSHLGHYLRGEAVIEPTSGDYESVQVRVVDTPGLGDSHGDDLSNILNVLEALNRMRAEEGDTAGVNAVVFVANANLPFSNSFQTIWRYYEACMPNLFSGVVVVNTKFSVSRWKQKQRAFKALGSESARQRTIRERRTDFSAVLEGRDPLHFFIDNEPDPRDLVEELISRNTMYDIMSLLATQGLMKIDEMRFVKSNDNRSVDAAVQRKLQHWKARWDEERKILLENVSGVEKRRSLLQAVIMDLENQINRRQHELSKLDNENEYKLGNFTTEEDTSALNVLAKAATFRRFKNTKDVAVLDKRVGRFDVEFLNARRARWTKSEWISANNIWRGHWQADMFHSPLLKARAYTKNRVIHAEEISEKETEIRSCAGKLRRARSEFDALPPKDASTHSHLDDLTLWIAQCNDALCKLEPKTVSLDVGFDEAARKRYKKGAAQVQNEDVIDAVRPFQPKLADVLETAYIKESA